MTGVKTKLGKMLETPVMTKVLSKKDKASKNPWDRDNQQGRFKYPLRDRNPSSLEEEMKIQSRLTEMLEVEMKPDIWVKEKFPKPLKTSEQNYWLGLLMTDGFVFDQRMGGIVLGLELQVRDGYLVSRFAKFIDKKARSEKRRVRVYRNCTKEIGYLWGHGIRLHKSGIEIWPDTVTDDMAFLRGVFDGDGSVSVSNKRSLAIAFYSASVPFLKSIAEKIAQHTGIDSYYFGRIKGARCYRIVYSLGYDKAKKFYKTLYSITSDEPRLHRKERIMRLFAERPKPFLGRPPTC
ncbi:MAG: LAGLIDADG family homing endonuclease [archaeon]